MFPIIAVAAMGFAAAGCSDDDDDDFVGAPPTQATMQVFVTDVPPEFDRLQNVNVSFQRVEAVAAVATGQTGDVVIPIFDSAATGGVQTVDLLPLRSGNRALIGSATVPPGVYDRLRFFFTDVEIVYNTPNGPRTYSTNNGTLIYGGQQQQGVNFVEFPLEGTGADAQAGDTEQLLADFDLGESIDVTGPTDNPTSITFTPIGRARDLTTSTGSIAGIVRSDNATPGDINDDTPIPFGRVTVRSNGDVTATTKTDATGTYVIEGLPAGQYQLIVVDPVDDTRSFESDVNVTDNQRTNTDVLLSTQAP